MGGRSVEDSRLRRAGGPGQTARPLGWFGSVREPQPVDRRDHPGRAFVDGVHDLSVIDATQVHGRDPEVGMLDMRVIWQAFRGSRGLRRVRVSPVGFGDAVGA